MRADVKLGVAISVVLVSIAGGYYAFRSEREKPIQVDSAAPGATKLATKATKPATTNNRSPKRNTTQSAQTTRGAKTARGANGRKSATPAGAQRVAGRRGGSTAGSTPKVVRPRPANSHVAGGTPKSAVTHPASTRSAGAKRTSVDPSAAGKPKSSLPQARAKQASADRSRSATGTPTRKATSPRLPSVSLAAPIARRTTPRTVDGAGLSNSAVDRHRVQSGDTMQTLSERYYGTPNFVAFLTVSNPQLTNPSRLQVGQVVQIPPRPAGVGAKPKASKPSGARAQRTKKVGKSYRVRPGDSFYKIAGSQLGSSARWQELYELNKATVGDDPGRLKVGQLLVLPSQ